jgi:HAD superfamily hydrolase (TIGR01509 family)
MSHWPASIFFDFDGVIVNSEPLHFASLRDVLADEKMAITQEEYFDELIGFDDRGAISHVFAKHRRALDPASLLRLMKSKSDAVRSMIRNRQYSALPGVDNFVRGLARHYPLAICSGALREEIESMLDGIELRACFPVIVAAEDVSVGKPDPQGYLLAADLVRKRTGLNFKTADCLIIEDAPSVIRSVKTAGFRTLGVAGSYPAGALGDADFVVQSLHPAEVLKHLPSIKIHL